MIVPLIASACAGSADVAEQQQAARIVAASRTALACRSTIAAQPRYQTLARHMPLVSVLDATLPQMTDTALASDEEVVALGRWLDALRDCHQELEKIVLEEFPLLIVPLVANWNSDDATFVQLARRKLAWGQAVLELRSHREQMLHTVADEVMHESQQASAERQAELSRRIALFNALTNLAP